jgi:hypothetical protein
MSCRSISNLSPGRGFGVGRLGPANATVVKTSASIEEFESQTDSHGPGIDIDDFILAGNRLDKLFQNVNDGCTNGIPIGPAFSDLVAERVLAGVDLHSPRP